MKETCPVCKQKCEGRIDMHFSKEGTWCNHAGWVVRTGATRDDPPILGSVDIGDAGASSATTSEPGKSSREL